MMLGLFLLPMNLPAENHFVKFVKTAGSIVYLVVLSFTAMLLFAISLCPWLGYDIYYLDTAAHFLPHALVGLCGVIILAFSSLHWRLGLAVLVMTSLAGIPVYPYLSLGGDKSDTVKVVSGVSIRVLCVNIHSDLKDLGVFKELLAKEKPDIIGIVEYSAVTRQKLKSLKESHPVFLERPAFSAWGIAFFSRFPVSKRVEKIELRHPGKHVKAPSILATLNVGSEVQPLELSFYLTHALSPRNADNFRHRNDLLRILPSELKEVAGPKILMGDLNVTPWSSHYRELLQKTRLSDPRVGRGVLGTFPAEFGVMGLPIDHVLVSKGITVREVRSGSYVGSDHLPLIVDLVIPWN